jgi:hypothetical protein
LNGVEASLFELGVFELEDDEPHPAAPSAL